MLDAALELFSTQGYANTSIEQLCKAAQVGTQAFYEAFTSREDCYVALLRRTAERVFGVVADAFAQAVDEGPADQDLEELLIAQFARAFSEDVRMARTSFGEGSAGGPDAERQRRKNLDEAATLVLSVWERVDQQPTEDQRAIAVGVVGGLFEIVADWTYATTVSGPTTQATPEEKERLLRSMCEFHDAVRHGRRNR